MPLTTTSGYTFPVPGVVTTQNPESGTASTLQPQGGSSEAMSDKNKENYFNWNGDWKGYLEYLANHGDQAALEKLLNYLMSENSAQIAREWTEKREDSAIQRFSEDARKAGFNPQALLNFGGHPIASSSSGNNYSGNNFSSYEVNSTKNEQNWLKVALTMMPIFMAIIAGAL